MIQERANQFVFKLALICLGLGILAAGCDEDQAANRPAQAPPTMVDPLSNDVNGVEQNQPLDPCSRTTPTTTLDSSSSQDPFAGGDNRFSLNSAITYVDTIHPILQKHCFSCHNSGHPKNLQDVQVAQQNLTAIVTNALGSHATSNGQNLTEADKNSIRQWQSASYPMGDLSRLNSNHVSDQTTTTGDPCDTVSVSPEETNIDDFNEALNPSELKECHDAGQMFIRKEKTCRPDFARKTEWCNSTGIKTAFGTLGDAAIDALNAAESEGYEIDQCGEAGDKRHVDLIKKVITGEKLVLHFRAIKNYSD